MGSVTCLVRRLTAKQSSALGEVVRRFGSRQRRVAARLLRGQPVGLAGPDDIVNHVLLRLWREVQTGTPASRRLCDTHSLLATLDLLTAQRVGKAREYDCRQRRDARRTVPLGDLGAVPAPGPADGPDLPARLTERQRRVGELLAEGWLQAEIADRLGVCGRTVGREIAAVRAALAEQSGISMSDPGPGSGVSG